MTRRLEWFIGLRYLRTGQGRGLVSFMSIASLLGITVGVAAVIVVLSAMNGLESEARSRLLSLANHISVRAEEPAGTDSERLAELTRDEEDVTQVTSSTLADVTPSERLAELTRDEEDVTQVTSSTFTEGMPFENLAELLRGQEDVTEVTPFMMADAILLSGDRYRSTVVRGIDPDQERDTTLAAAVGPELLLRLAASDNGVLLGRYIAADLGLQPGDPVQLLLPEVESGLVEPHRVAARVVGVFAVGAEEHDSNLALMNLADVGRFAGAMPQGLSVRITEPMDVGRVEQRLRTLAGAGYAWSNWAVENRSVFRAMAIEKTMMTILLLFIVAVAAFNIVTSLTMVVNEKARDIAILRTLGLEPGRVVGVFIVQGAVVGIGGIVLGVALGWLVAINLETLLPWVERTLGFQIMPGDVYYVTEVPSELRLRDFVVIPGLTLVIALIATMLPSRRAAGIDPAEALRYE